MFSFINLCSSNLTKKRLQNVKGFKKDDRIVLYLGFSYGHKTLCVKLQEFYNITGEFYWT